MLELTLPALLDPFDLAKPVRVFDRGVRGSTVPVSAHDLIERDEFATFGTLNLQTL